MVVIKLNKGTIKTASLLFFITLVGLSLISLLKISISADVTSATSNTTSNATIEKNVAISLSNNLTAGIIFGIVTAGNERNATGNFNATGENTSFVVVVDSTTNVPVDLCINVNDTLRSDYDNAWTIANTNYKYSWNESIGFSNHTVPDWPPVTAITSTYAKTLEDMDMRGGTINVTFRFSLDVPGGTRAGTYTNQVSFKGTENITSC